MLRGLALVVVCLALPAAAARQELGVLRIRVVLTAADETVTPIRRHLLLVSDNPASAPPRRVLTGADGTAEVRLRPGNYTVESDQAVAFEGRSHRWVQTLDLVAGRDSLLELTAANAEADDGPAAPMAGEDRVSLAARWQDSVVEVWTPTAHASGALVETSGLVVTNTFALGRATTVEVQLSRARKVLGQVLAADTARDIAVLRIDATAAAAVPPVPLGCGQEPAAASTGDEIVAVEAPLGQPKGANRGVVRRVATRVIESDLTSGRGGSGGPVFSLRGALLGITSEGDARMRATGGDTRVMRTNEICAVLELARSKMAGAAVPSGLALPVEPAAAFPTATLTDAEALSRHPLPQTSSNGFDIAFLTPLHVHGGKVQRIAAQGRSARIDAAYLRTRLLTEFANWDDYVAELPPVVFVRVTPKLVESFWMKVARGAAYTQGVALPALKRPTSGFARLRAFCGSDEVVPIHPFVLEIDGVGEERVAEGLYAFDPSALTPACATVRLELFSQKDPAKADAVVVAPALIEQVWADFASYRAAAGGAR